MTILLGILIAMILILRVTALQDLAKDGTKAINHGQTC
jgi:hypothetical protein